MTISRSFQLAFTRNFLLFSLSPRNTTSYRSHCGMHFSGKVDNYSGTLLSLATNKALAILYNEDRSPHDVQRGVFRMDRRNESVTSFLWSTTLPLYHHLTSPSQVATSILVYPIGDFEVKKQTNKNKQMACFKSKTKRSSTDWMDLFT